MKGNSKVESPKRSFRFEQNMEAPLSPPPTTSQSQNLFLDTDCGSFLGEVVLVRIARRVLQWKYYFQELFGFERKSERKKFSFNAKLDGCGCCFFVVMVYFLDVWKHAVIEL